MGIKKIGLRKLKTNVKGARRRRSRMIYKSRERSAQALKQCKTSRSMQLLAEKASAALTPLNQEFTVLSLSNSTTGYMRKESKNYVR